MKYKHQVYYGKSTAIKLFDTRQVRTVWDAEQEKWHISIVDTVAVLTDSPNPRNYWKVLKHRLIKEGNESVTNCNQLKMQAADGKYYLTEQYKAFKGLKKENLRDNMTNTELILNMLAEASAKDISQAENPQTFSQSANIAQRGGNVAGVARKNIFNVF